MMPLTLTLTGIVFVIAGIYLRYSPPGKRNLLIGYRTNRSLHSQEAWDFSQKYSGRLMFGSGIIVLAIGLISWILPIALFWVEFSVTMIVIFAGAITPVLVTEKKLRKKFPLDKS